MIGMRVGVMVVIVGMVMRVVVIMMMTVRM
jgi:hypothetical protein